MNLLDLAQELIDEILCWIDSPQDLVAFALASHLCASIAIPRHTEYRVLYIPTRRPDIWEHLARFPNSTSNFREVHIDFRKNSDGRVPERYPVTLVDPKLDDSDDASDQDVIDNMCKAFATMKRLTTVTWHSRSQERVIPLNQRATFTEALTRLPALRRLSMMWASDSRAEYNSDLHPTWNISHLTHLRLRGTQAAYREPTPSQTTNIARWIQKSPGLVCLHMLARTLSLVAASSDFVLPVLTTLAVYGSSQESVIQFIQRHPTIEELRWCLLDTVHPLPHGFLPNCKRFQVSVHILDALEANYSSTDEPPSARDLRRQVEVIHFADLQIPDLLSYRFLNPIGLIVLRTSQDLEKISAHAARFPMIRWLEIIPREGYPNWTLDEWIDALSQFAHLDTIGECNIWDLVHNGRVTEPELIRRLALACPNLRYLNNFDNQQDQGHRLAIYRPPCEEFDEGMDSDVVCYVVQKRRTRSRQTMIFEPMEGVYDNSGYLQPPQRDWRTVQLHSQTGDS
ncbi:hypothetical protein BDN72DRAFT_218499 [Pluteus cervinus]|uniref:Uncharacterized protein n=1 Tax=Pluteus cervinus TaxID=181527 RepID=A0ACD3AHD8_9AGAR|nr:hypothetical protein BDN72DRAFT_218499 [Pluteus cervinus]